MNFNCEFYADNFLEQQDQPSLYFWSLLKPLLPVNLSMIMSADQHLTSVRDHCDKEGRASFLVERIAICKRYRKINLPTALCMISGKEYNENLIIVLSKRSSTPNSITLYFYFDVTYPGDQQNI